MSKHKYHYCAASYVSAGTLQSVSSGVYGSDEKLLTDAQLVKLRMLIAEDLNSNAEPGLPALDHTRILIHSLTYLGEEEIKPE